MNGLRNEVLAKLTSASLNSQSNVESNKPKQEAKSAVSENRIKEIEQ